MAEAEVTYAELPPEGGDPTKYDKPRLDEIRGYTLAALIILLIFILLFFIGMVLMAMHFYPRLSERCSDGDPTTNDYELMGSCWNIFAGIGAECSDVCLVDGAGTVQIDHSGLPVCNGTSIGQCDAMFMAPDTDCPDVIWVDLVEDAGIDNITFCGFGRCIYTLHVGMHGDDSIIDTLSWIMNTDTMADKLNALCMDFISDEDPNKQCMQASIFPLDFEFSNILCLYSYHNSHLDFGLIEDMFLPDPPMLQGKPDKKPVPDNKPAPVVGPGKFGPKVATPRKPHPDPKVNRPPPPKKSEGEVRAILQEFASKGRQKPKHV